jgi:integrase/recombinase XerC
VQEHQKTGANRRVVDSLATEFLNYLRAERDASALTIRNYSADIAAFAAWFEQKYKQKCDWPRVDLFHLRGYLVHLTERQFDRATIHLKMSALRSFFKWQVRTEHVKQNPLVGLTLPKKSRKLPKFLTIHQVEALLDAPLKGEAKDRLSAWRDKAILETLYSAGLRIHELMQLNDEDMDLLGEVVRIRGKGKKERLAALGGPAIETLQ